jgi:tRNA threonylcarbamoyladenosine biosynthesis protein TsaE
MQFLSKSLEETAAVAADFLKYLSALQNDSAVVVGLYGNLGSGKTSFTQALGKTLGVLENITSPTFVIMKRFVLHDHSFENLIHIDAYRLEAPGEIEKLGWKEAIADRRNLILVEWPEKVGNVMPENHIKIHFTFIDETTRQIEWE